MSEPQESTPSSSGASAPERDEEQQVRSEVKQGSGDAAAQQTPVEARNDDRGLRKVREGLVVSDKMAKTIVVSLEDRVKHPRYSKVIRRTKKVKAHDEENTAGPGDRVLLMETRPLSATKRWRLVEILEKAK
jgi:small subunit ribosomal protein S17